ncbi:Putative disease resistance TIR-NBS-LRR class protein [Prunus dulcis]|uniref:Disease resistance TIR-NBS-LRR class protein n=1 Tax=Prunus dulcis TaxID=3755 RepID=A0A4Y1RFM9_PRUDU|nr:Putative disease resistance TIR-NBS-LRR class protein [Prunus dulcis]
MERFFKRKLSTDSSSLSNPGSSNARPIEVDEILANLQADPGLRTRMADYSPNIRDEIRRAYLQKGPCQPRSYKFPQTNQSGINRRFIAHWFDDHDWLEYSIAKDAAFCLHCYLFKSNFDQVGGDAFTGVGFNNWKKAKERFNLHIGPVGSVHNQAREVAYNLMHQTTHIETIVIKQTSQARTAYRTCLNASLKCTRYLLRQGLSFRGHDESAQSSNKGNYLELLQFLADHDEKVKAVVLENAPGNLKLIAPSIQKDLVNSCAKETIDLILSDVKDRYFSIMVDEARDVSIKEQMAMVLRYVNDKGQIIERFVGVQHVTDTTSSALKEAIDEFFSSANLSFSKLRGQGYDGASNMRGEFNGLKTKILREQPCAFYVHCFAHQLQLALVAVAKKNIDVNSFFTTANSLVNVVGASCKRRDALRAQYQEELVRAFEDDCLITGRGLNQERTLKRAGDTRWNSHYGTLISIISMFPSVVNVLQMIVDDNPNDSSGEAYKLWREIQSFEFVFHLFVMKAILGITNTLSLALQKKDQDIVSAMNLVKTCKENLQLMRDNEFEELVEQASSFCYKHDIIVPTMDEEYVIPGRSRRNAPMKTNYHRYRVEIFIHVIDGQLAELNDRFNEVSTELLTCLACLSPKNNFVAFDKRKLVRLAQFYPYDFSDRDLLMLEDQLGVYVHHMRSSSDFSQLEGISSLAEKMVEKGMHEIFPFVYLLLTLALVLPVATASVERAFSAMNIIKNPLRNRMGDQWLNDSLIVYIREMFLLVLITKL